MAHCNSPGCSRPNESSYHNCGSPGCSRRGQYSSQSSYTQDDYRPAAPAPSPGSSIRTSQPKNAEFSRVITEIRSKHYVLAILHYPDVQKYNGVKLVVYASEVWDSLNKRQIDPHFYPDDQGPIARFTPNAAGLTHAFAMVVPESEVKIDARVAMWNILINILTNFSG